MQTVFHCFKEFHILQADSVNVINQVASQRQDVNALQLESLGIMRSDVGLNDTRISEGTCLPMLL